MRWILVWVWVFTGFFGAMAQETIHSEKIPYRNIRKLLIRMDLKDAQDMKNVHATCYSPNQEQKFINHKKTYRFKDVALDTLWSIYTTGDQAKLWTGKRYKFGLGYKDGFYYTNQSVSGIHRGQSLFLKLKLLKGLLQMPVAFEFTAVDTLNHCITFCYLEHGKTRGTQTIQFTAHTDEIVVEHITTFQCDNRFRNSLYPFFHTRLITEFHTTVKKRLKASKKVY
jgi:hypothetical protein